MACINRTLEDVEKLVELAKLDASKLFPCTQTLEFPAAYNPEKYLLLQLPNKLIDAVKQGDELILRGDSDDFAVLCTDNETFEVREAETSNSLVLVPSMLTPEDMKSIGNSRELLHKEIVGVHNKYLEVRPCLPRLGKLRELLSECPYAGPSHVPMDDDEQRMYDMTDLLDRVQSSDDQLRSALEDLPALFIDGHWRMLEFEYFFGATSSVLGVIEEQQWPLDAVPRVQLKQQLRDVEPEPVIDLCLRYFFTNSDENDDILAIQDEKISRLFAEVLLRPADRFNLNEFLTIWQQSVPPGVNTSADQLEGLALVDRNVSPPVVWLYPEHQLPEDPAMRFSQLFEVKNKWSLNEISPYIRKLASSNCSVSSLLAKHTRAATHNGIKYYSAKHTR